MIWRGAWDEADEQMEFTALMGTNHQELAALKATSGNQQSDHAQRSLDRSDANEEHDDTKNSWLQTRRSLTLPTGCKDRLDNGLTAVASVPRV